MGASCAASLANLKAYHMLMIVMTLVGAMLRLASRMVSAARQEALHIEAIEYLKHVPILGTMEKARAALLAFPAVQQEIRTWSRISAVLSWLGSAMLHSIVLGLITANARFKYQCGDPKQALAVVISSICFCFAYGCVVTITHFAARPPPPRAFMASTGNGAQGAAGGSS